MLYVENDRPENSARILQILKALDYRMYLHRVYYFNENNYFNDRDNIFFNQESASLLCMPRRLHAVAMVGFEEL